jgi:hypothetical protein
MRRKIVGTELKRKSMLLAVALALTTVTSTWGSPINGAPSTGAILDLNGTPIPGDGYGAFQQYTVNFVAVLANTTISFEFRDDPAAIEFEDVSVTDLTTPAGNLLVNGSFSGGVYTDNENPFTPTGWTYANVFGASGAGGVNTTSCTVGPASTCWFDGAVQAYDAISQTIPTNIGDAYQVSFYLAELSGSSWCGVNNGGTCADFSRLSTNGDVTDSGGNGLDALVYAGLPSDGASSIPEPSSLWLVGTVACLAAMRLGKSLRRQ